MNSQLERECAYVIEDIRKDASGVIGESDIDCYEAVCTLFRVCAEAGTDEAEIGRRVRDLIFLPAVRMEAAQRVDEFYDVFGSEAEEHRHFDDKERTRDLRRAG